MLSQACSSAERCVTESGLVCPRCALQAPPQQIMGGAPAMGMPQQGMYPPPQACTNLTAHVDMCITPRWGGCSASVSCMSQLQAQHRSHKHHCTRVRACMQGAYPPHMAQAPPQQVRPCADRRWQVRLPLPAVQLRQAVDLLSLSCRPPVHCSYLVTPCPLVSCISCSKCRRRASTTSSTRRSSTLRWPRASTRTRQATRRRCVRTPSEFCRHSKFYRQMPGFCKLPLAACTARSRPHTCSV